MYKKPPEVDRRYEQLFVSDEAHITEAISSCGMSYISLLHHYMDSGVTGMSLREWVVTEFKKPKEVTDVVLEMIPDYVTGTDAIELFGNKRVDGNMTEVGLALRGAVIAVQNSPEEASPLPVEYPSSTTQ